jgi:hypothetical protein
VSRCPHTGVCLPATHEAMKVEPVWSSLAYVGANVFDADETGPAERHEHRNCECGSTLTRVFTITEGGTSCAGSDVIGHGTLTSDTGAPCHAEERAA